MSQEEFIFIQVKHILGVYSWLLLWGIDISLDNFSNKWIKRYAFKFRKRVYRRVLRAASLTN